MSISEIIEGIDSVLSLTVKHVCNGMIIIQILRSINNYNKYHHIHVLLTNKKAQSCEILTMKGKVNIYRRTCVKLKN